MKIRDVMTSPAIRIGHAAGGADAFLEAVDTGKAAEGAGAGGVEPVPGGGDGFVCDIIAVGGAMGNIVVLIARDFLDAVYGTGSTALGIGSFVMTGGEVDLPEQVIAEHALVLNIAELGAGGSCGSSCVKMGAGFGIGEAAEGAKVVLINVGAVSRVLSAAVRADAVGIGVSQRLQRFI